MGLTSESEMKKIVAHIGAIDKKFIPVLDNSPLCTIGRRRSNRTHYQVLVSSVLSQQLAVKAADTIERRVVELAGGEIHPESMVKLSAAQLRAAGVSGAKSKAIAGLTDASLTGEINFKSLGRLSNEEISDQLTKLWGIGRWTVEMFLIFHMGRLDIWPVGDLGVRRGWELIHNLKEEIDPKKLDPLGNKFEGMQSVVAWYCWRAKDAPK